jgi:hypothetical protein
MKEKPTLIIAPHKPLYPLWGCDCVVQFYALWGFLPFSIGEW